VIFHQPARAIGFGLVLAVSGLLLLRGLLREPA